MSTLTLLHSHEAVRELESRLLRALTLARLRGERPRSSDERFEIEGMLGRGASGIVCKATDHKLGRQIALKLFPGVRDSQLAGSVRNEARALGGLNHPNVVTVFDFDALAITPGSIHCFFVAMELLDGVSLRHWLARGQSKRAIVRMFCQAGDGLAAAHEQSLIHRDFKPENVMIHKGAPKIVDFGLAHAEIAAGLTSDPGLETRQRPLAGTLAYMAPEALRGRTDAKSDQFSFAAALWEALLGDLPYPIHSTAPEERQQIRAPADARAIPGEVVAVLLRALDAEPSRRFPTIAELVACLQALPEIPDAPPESLFAATSALELTADPLGIGVGADASALPPQDLQASFGAASIVDRSILGKRPRRRRRLLAASFFFGAAAVGSGYVAVSELGLPVDPRQLFEHAPPLTVAAPPMVEPPPPAPPCADEREVVGDWRFATYATWATQSRWQGLSGRYELALTLDERTCQLTLALSKLGNDTLRYKEPMVDARVVRLAPAPGIPLRIHQELAPRRSGASAADFQYTFEFVFLDGQLRGRFEARTTQGGLAFIGSLAGERDGAEAPTDAPTDARQPCWIRCGLQCLGERSIQACRERCDERWRAPDSCAAPDSDITFADFDASTKSCKPEHAAALAGTWTIQTSPANGDPGSRYRVKLDVDGCKLFVGRGKELSSSRRSITGGGRVVGGHSWALDVKAGHESMKWTFAGRAPGFGQFSVKARAVAGTATAHRDP